MPNNTEDMARILTAINKIDSRLDTLVKLIRQQQTAHDGSVILRLQNCGKKCSGCPHPRWEKWVGGSYKKYRWHRVKIDSPLRHINAKSMPSEAAQSIREAVYWLERRKKIMANLANVKRAAMWVNKHL